MATPLRDVLLAAVTDTDARTALERSPGNYLAEHGWQDLDVADLQEAMLILADGGTTTDAVTWVTGAEAIDTTENDLGQALSVALAAMQVPPDPEDPTALDGFEDDGRDAPASDPFDGPIGGGVPDVLDYELAAQDAGPQATWLDDQRSTGDADRPDGDPPVEAAGIELDLLSEQHGDQLPPGPFDEPDDGTHGIGRDDIGGYGAEPASDQHQAPDDDWDGLL